MPRRRTATVRFRVTAVATVVVGVMLTVAGFALVANQRRVMYHGLDESLAVAGARLAAGAPEGTVLPVLIDDDGVAQIVRDGDVIASTLNLAGRAPMAPAPGGDQQARTVDHLVAGAGAYRVVSQRVVGTDGAPRVVHVGAPTDDIEQNTDELAIALAVTLPVVVVLLAALVWHLVGRTLAPVEAIRAEVAAIGAGGLDHRVPAPTSDDEIGRLAVTMNEMLDRVEDAARRQERFVADASHELRGPLTRIRSEIEVDLAHPRDADLRATHVSVLAEATELQRLVDDLLALARSDAVGGPPVDRPVDLDDVVLRATRRLRDRARLTIDTTGVSAAQVRGDPRQLARAVGNLLDNAARHAAGRVTTTLTEEHGAAVLTVSDDGRGIPDDQRERIFDRFTRVDADRHRDAGGAGLGLAITREIVERHGGTITVDPATDGGARFVVRIPTDGVADRP